MADYDKFSITMQKEKARKIRDLVEAGKYPTISAAFDAAADALTDLEHEREAWWAENIRRCKEAEAHPERLMDADEFHTALWSRIDKLRQTR